MKSQTKSFSSAAWVVEGNTAAEVVEAGRRVTLPPQKWRNVAAEVVEAGRRVTLPPQK